MNDFAVQYRYESFEELSGDLDRETVVKEVTHLIEHIEKLVNVKGAK